MNHLAKRVGILIVCLAISTICQGQTIHPAVSFKRTIGSDFLGTNAANVIRQISGVNDPNLVANAPKLKPLILRYPGGDIASWWDWHTGWFVNSVALPSKYYGLPFKPNTLENLRTLVTGCNATVMFVLNMITDSLHGELQMLQHAASIGLPVKYVEMGSELYPGQTIDDTLQQKLYPNAHVFGVIANQWIDTLRKYFPGAKFSVPAAFNTYGTDAPPALIQWNDTLLKYAPHADAISLHPYVDAEDPKADSTQIQEYPKDINMFLYQPFYMFQLMEIQSAKAATYGKEIWNSEYNLSDQNRVVHGRWAQGLFIATQTLEMLYDSRVTHAVTYSADGTGVHGMFFYDDSGFNFGAGGDGAYLGPLPPPPTVAWSYTSGGNTMSLVGPAMATAKYATPLSFSPTLNISYLNPSNYYTTYSTLYGWMFSTDINTATVIMNFDSLPHLLSTSELWPSGGMYQQRSAYALNYIATPSDITSKGPINLTSTIILPGYSITYITGHDIPGAPPPPIHITATKTKMCQGEVTTLSVPSGYLKYLWSNGASSKSITVDSGGEYSVKVWKIANGYYATDSVDITVNKLPKKPNIAQSGTIAFCKGGSVTLLLNNDPGNVTYLWNTGEKTQQITVTTGGNYYLFDTDSNGCQNVSDTIGVTVYPLPNPTIKALGSTIFCGGGSVELATNGGYNNYYWSNGKHGHSMDTILVSTQGAYTCMVTDVNGCDNTTSPLNVTVLTVPNPTITAGGPITFCSGGSVMLSTLTGYQKYQWVNGAGNINGATQQSYTATSGANYKVTITDVNGCYATTMNATSVTVNKLPTASISYNGSTNICSGTTYLLKTKTGTGYSFQWYRNGLKVTGATSSAFTVSKSGSYYYVVTTNQGCVNTSNTITFTSNCREEASSENSNVFGSLDVYPNPSSGGAINIALKLPDNSDQECLIEVRNSLGALVMQHTITENSGQASYEWIPDENIVSGLYFVIVHAGGETYNSKLIIAH